MKDHESIDILHLVTEPPKPHDPITFDPEVDITEEDRKNIKNHLESLKRSNNFIWYFPLAFFALSLFPQRAEEFGVDQITPEGIIYLKEGIDLERRSLSSQGRLIDFIYLKTLAPKEFDKLPIDPAEKEKLRENIGLASTHGPIEDLVYAVTLKTIFPEETILFTSNDWQKIKDRFNERFNFRGFTFTQYRLQQLVLTAKVFFPSLCHELEPRGLSLSEQIRKNLPHFRENGSWGALLIAAFTAHLFAAEKVIITERGLEIIMPEPQPVFTTPIPPMPTRRNF